MAKQSTDLKLSTVSVVSVLKRAGHVQSEDSQGVGYALNDGFDVQGHGFAGRHKYSDGGTVFVYFREKHRYSTRPATDEQVAAFNAKTEAALASYRAALEAAGYHVQATKDGWRQELTVKLPLATQQALIKAAEERYAAQQRVRAELVAKAQERNAWIAQQAQAATQAPASAT